MKILEVKNNLVKISYTAEDNLILAGFVIIEDSQCPYVAQVMSLKADSGLNYAIVKLLFTFNEEGVVKNYNGTIPELNASITRLSSDELLDILPVEEPLKIGVLAQQDFVLNIDYSSLEKNLLVCSDKTENTDLLLSNLAKQITDNNNKSVIFDTDSTINAENKLVFGRDFKLPLNYDTINFIYENDLNDVNPTSKAVIQDIFLEVQEYSKTVLDNFIPFDSFISVVEAQYRELNIPELALLKSRLLKYKEENAFAQDAKEFQSLRASIRANLSTLIDISTADDLLQKQIINYVYDEINAMDLFVYSFVKINNDNSDKKLIRKFLLEDKIYTTVIAPHSFKYVYELKDRASNTIMFAPQTTQHDFAAYNVYLNKLNDDECVIFGKATQNIPLIVEVLPIEELDEIISHTPATDTTEESVLQEQESVDDFSDESNSYSYETMANDTVEMEPIPEEQPEELVTLPEENLEEVIPATEEAVPAQDEVFEAPQKEFFEEETTDFEEATPDFEEDELTVPDLDEPFGDEVTEPEQEYVEENYMEEPVEGQLIEEEPVFTDEIEQPQEDEYIENEEQDYLEEPLTEPVLEDDNFMEVEEESVDEGLPIVNEIEDAEPLQDTLTEDDLDYIQDVNMPEEDIEEQVSSNMESDYDMEQEVPVYPADDITYNPNTVSYEPGDRVSHPKYGEGIVEKMLKYGNKILCSINFENGRRLLDPSISELQKL